MIKFKLYPKEHYDQQKEKHNAYTKAGYELVAQKQDKNSIEREYEKIKFTDREEIDFMEKAVEEMIT